MNWLYPKLRHVRHLIFYVFLAALMGGVYGMIHDQLSYTISPEYFTRFKFFQFHYLNYGFHDRVFVGMIGFLAVWWVGMIAGWFLSRIRFNSDDITTARSDLLSAFLIVFGVGLVALVVGAMAGYIRSFYFTPDEFYGIEEELSGTRYRRFVVVGYIHSAGYTGGVIGFIIAAILMKRKMRRE